jgi:hypothetical protein
MSANMYAWEPAIRLDPHASDFDSRVDAYSNPASRSPPSAAIRAFVSALLARYPDLTKDEHAPWADGPLIGDASGGFINVSIVWHRYEETRSFFVHAAGKLGLHAYDPQSGTFFPAKAHAKSTDWRSGRNWAWCALVGVGIAATTSYRLSRRELLSGRLRRP